MKKAITMVLCICQILIFSGCYDYMETESRAIVAGAFVEKATEDMDAKYKLTAEIVNTQAETSASNEPQTINKEGISLLSAIEGASSASGRKLYFGHSQIMIIDENVAREGIRPICDFVSRQSETRLSQLILVSKGVSGEEIFKNKDDEKNIKSFDFSRMMSSNEKNAINAPIPAYVFIREWLSEGIDSILPMIEIKNGDAEISGMALFKDDKMVGELGENHTKYLLFCKNLADGGGFVLKRTSEDGGDIGFDIKKRNAKVKTEVVEDKIGTTIELTVDLAISEVMGKQGILVPSKMDKLEADCERMLKNGILDMLKIIQTNNGCDALGIGKQVYEKYPERWRVYEQVWDERYKEVEFSVKVNCTVSSSGRTATDLVKSEEWKMRITE